MRGTGTTGVLEGKVALVLGASRGIGAAVARAYVAAGARVVVAARDRAALDQLVVEVAEDSDAAHREGGGPVAMAVPTDATDDAAVAELVERTVATFGRLDVACNNAAGGGHPPTPLAQVPVEAFDTAVSVNLRGVFVAMGQEIAAMVATGGGAIVNMSSTAGFEPVAGLAAYVSTKFGLEGLTRVAALDHAADGVRVNAIAPGPILTDNLRRAGPDAQQVVASTVPVGRVGRPEEVAAAAVWLCSDAAAFVTGTTLVVDGGLTAGSQPFARRRPTAGGTTT